MSDSILPWLPCFGRDVSREPFGDDKIYTSASGKEQRYSWWSISRIRYEIPVNGARAYVQAPGSWSAFSEIGVLRQFWAAHRMVDSFLMVDFEDSSTMRVRFDQTLQFRRLVPGVWVGSLHLVSVK